MNKELLEALAKPFEAYMNVSLRRAVDYIEELGAEFDEDSCTQCEKQYIKKVSIIMNLVRDILEQYDQLVRVNMLTDDYIMKSKTLINELRTTYHNVQSIIK